MSLQKKKRSVFQQRQRMKLNRKHLPKKISTNKNLTTITDVKHQVDIKENILMNYYTNYIKPVKCECEKYLKITESDQCMTNKPIQSLESKSHSNVNLEFISKNKDEIGDVVELNSVRCGCKHSCQYYNCSCKLNKTDCNSNCFCAKTNCKR